MFVKVLYMPPMSGDPDYKRSCCSGKQASKCDTPRRAQWPKRDMLSAAVASRAADGLQAPALATAKETALMTSSRATTSAVRSSDITFLDAGFTQSVVNRALELCLWLRLGTQHTVLKW